MLFLKIEKNEMMHKDALIYRSRLLLLTKARISVVFRVTVMVVHISRGEAISIRWKMTHEKLISVIPPFSLLHA